MNTKCNCGEEAFYFYNKVFYCRACLNDFAGQLLDMLYVDPNTSIALEVVLVLRLLED